MVRVYIQESRGGGRGRLISDRVRFKSEKKTGCFLFYKHALSLVTCQPNISSKFALPVRVVTHMGDLITDYDTIERADPYIYGRSGMLWPRWHMFSGCSPINFRAWVCSAFGFLQLQHSYPLVALQDLEQQG